MIHESKCRKVQAEEARSRRVLPCRGPDSIALILPRVSRPRSIFRRRRSCAALATSSICRARSAARRAFAIGPAPACSTTWATWLRASPAILNCSIRNTAAPRVSSSLPRTPLNIGCPKPAPHTAWCPWPCASSWRPGCPIKPPVGICGGITGYLFVSLPAKTGWRLGGKKAAWQMWTNYLAWSLADFSGSIAVDERYDGPFCVLSLVANPTYKRLLYQGLAHTADHTDITAFFRRFQRALRLRGLAVGGVTPDGSPLYPEPLRRVFGDVPHQLCEFHSLKE